MPRYFRVGGALLAVLLACLLGVSSASAATAGSRTGDSTADTYLALGDSVPFGYDPRLVNPGVEPDAFVGYPQLAAWWSHPTLKLVNASCPGETSTSLITGAAADDNGCQAYRTSVGDLHVSYSGSQLQYATDYVAAHPRTEVISLMVGANDVFKLQKSCAAGPATVNDCVIAGLPALLSRLQGNVTTIYRALKHAGFTGRLVPVTYYSLNYGDKALTAAVSAVNDVLTHVPRRLHSTVADGFTAWEKAAAPFGGDSCAAGLLIRLTPEACDVHPSPAGARLLASTVRSAVQQIPDAA